MATSPGLSPLTSNTAWSRHQGSFNSMTDEEVERECREAQDRIDQDEEWLEAVAAWKKAGKPRRPLT